MSVYAGSNGSTGSSSSTNSFASSKESASPARATIGPGVTVKGEISGEEDILIEGSVEGLVSLKQNCVTIAKGGKVKANVHGLVVLVEGEITGDIFATERVTVKVSGRVHGNITSPRVAIDEGSRIRGSLNTDVDDVGAVSERSVTSYDLSKAIAKSDSSKKNSNNGTVVVERQ